MNDSSILNMVPFGKGAEQCSSDIRWQNKVTVKSWWRKAVSGQVAIYTKGAFTLEMFVFWISDQDAEKALNTTVFHLSVCVCAHVACLEVENMQIRNPPMIHRRAGKKQVQPQQPSVCCCVLCSAAAFEQMQEAVRATYQTDHTRLREKCTRHGPGYSWLLSCGEKEVRGDSSVWEVLTGKDEGAKQCRKCCRLHTHIQKEKGKREKKKDKTMDVKCWENFHLGS